MSNGRTGYKLLWQQMHRLYSVSCCKHAQVKKPSREHCLQHFQDMSHTDIINQSLEHTKSLSDDSTKEAIVEAAAEFATAYVENA